MTYRRITKQAAFKRFVAGLPFQICPVKLRPGFPWAPDMTVDPAKLIEKQRDSWRWEQLWRAEHLRLYGKPMEHNPDTSTTHDKLYHDYPESDIPKQAFECMIREFNWYNCNCNETGRYPAFYVID